MQYPKMNRTPEYRVSVPELNGGVNLSVPAHRISDNQLSVAENVWYRGGRLKTRPALRGVRIAGHDEGTTYRYGSVGDYGFISGQCDNGVSNKRYFTLVCGDGQVRPHPTLNSGRIHGMMAASAKGSEDPEHGTEDVLVYVSGEKDADSGVFRINTKTADWAKQAPFVPTVLINGRPQDTPFRAVTGDQLEPYNMLSDEYVCTFTPDGEHAYFILPNTDETPLEVTYRCLVDGEYANVPHTMIYDAEKRLYINTAANASTYSAVYDPSTGSLWFYENIGHIVGEYDPSAAVPLPEGTDNSVSVKMRRRDDVWKEGRDTILGMHFSTWFGGGSGGLSGGTRLFVGGNPDHPNLVHWSALNAPLYFPDGNYAYVGEDTNAVTAFGKQSDMLVIFKERELYYTTYHRGSAVTAEDVQMQREVDVEAAAAVFPLWQLHPDIGCDCPGTIRLCNDRLVWLNGDGRVYGLFGAGVYSERNVRSLSSSVEKRLRAIPRDVLRASTAACYEEHYLLLVGNEMVVMDYSSYGFQYYGSYSTDEKAQKSIAWYVWNSAAALDALVCAGNAVVIIGAAEGDPTHRYTLLFDEAKERDDVPAYNAFENVGTITARLQTKLFDMGDPEYRKRLNTVYVQLSGKRSTPVYVGYHSGEWSYENRDCLVLTGDSPEAAAPFRLTPNLVRVRQFGLSLASEGRIEVGSLVLNYRRMGVVR